MFFCKPISGRDSVVYVRFKINTEGEIEDVKIVGGVHEVLDKEAVRVVNKLPKWKPGMKDGKTISVYYTIPISFNRK